MSTDVDLLRNKFLYNQSRVVFDDQPGAVVSSAVVNGAVEEALANGEQASALSERRRKENQRADAAVALNNTVKKIKTLKKELLRKVLRRLSHEPLFFQAKYSRDFLDKLLKNLKTENIVELFNVASEAEGRDFKVGLFSYLVNFLVWSNLKGKTFEFPKGDLIAAKDLKGFFAIHFTVLEIYFKQEVLNVRNLRKIANSYRNLTTSFNQPLLEKFARFYSKYKISLVFDEEELRAQAEARARRSGSVPTPFVQKLLQEGEVKEDHEAHKTSTMFPLPKEITAENKEANKTSKMFPWPKSFAEAVKEASQKK